MRRHSGRVPRSSEARRPMSRSSNLSTSNLSTSNRRHSTSNRLLKPMSSSGVTRSEAVDRSTDKVRVEKRDEAGNRCVAPGESLETVLSHSLVWCG